MALPSPLASHDLIETENSLLATSEKHARILRLQRKQEKEKNYHLNMEQQYLSEAQYLIQNAVNDLIETENSRLVSLEKHARELRRHRKEFQVLKNHENEINEKLDETIYELDELKEQNKGLQSTKEEMKKEIDRLNNEIKEKETLNKGLVDSLLKEANAHKETILQHQRDEEARLASLPQVEDNSTQTGSDLLVEKLRQQTEQLSAEVKALQLKNESQQEELDNYNSENTYLQTQFDQQVNELTSLQKHSLENEDKIHLLEMKLKAANYEIEHMNGDYKGLMELENELKDANQHKDETINKLTNEIQTLQKKDHKLEQQVLSLNGHNQELTETLKETNEALELLQAELFELKGKLKHPPNNNQLESPAAEEEEEEQQRESVLPDIRSHTNQSSRGSGGRGGTGGTGGEEDEPDHASQSYSAEGYQNNIQRKARLSKGYHSDSDGDTKTTGPRNGKIREGVDLQPTRVRNKKKKEKQVDPNHLPRISHKKLESGSVVSALSIEETESPDEDKKKRVLKTSRSHSGAISARGASVAYKLTQLQAHDERQLQHQRLLEQKEKGGGCTQCGRRIKGDPKKLPSSLKNLVVDDSNNSQVSSHKSVESQHHSIIGEAFLGGYPILENHLDHQLAIRDKYSHPRGQHCIFCSWDCAKKWNAKNTPVNLRYETHKLICIAAGSFE